MDEGSTRSSFRNLLDRMNRQRKPISYLPSIFTLFRLAALPTLIFLMDTGQVIPADSLFLLAISSDLVDGYLARKLKVASKFGANFDVTIDFLFVSGVFLFFTVKGIYPLWVLGVILAMYFQFLVTSNLTKVIFDPFGKYYGSLLYGAVGLTMLFSGQTARDIITVAFVAVTGVSLASRIISYISFKK